MVGKDERTNTAVLLLLPATALGTRTTNRYLNERSARLCVCFSTLPPRNHFRNFGDNSFSGTIPHTLGNCNQMHTLYVSSLGKEEFERAKGLVCTNIESGSGGRNSKPMGSLEKIRFFCNRHPRVQGTDSHWLRIMTTRAGFNFRTR